MKVRNLYIGKISKLENVRIKTEYDESIIDQVLRSQLSKRYLCANVELVRTSIFYKKNNNKMKDLIYGGSYPVSYNKDTAIEGFEYVSQYASISTAFNKEKISKKSLLKKYKDGTIKYNREKNGGNNE